MCGRIMSRGRPAATVKRTRTISRSAAHLSDNPSPLQKGASIVVEAQQENLHERGCSVSKRDALWVSRQWPPRLKRRKTI
jgi:hypothetical protein